MLRCVASFYISFICAQQATTPHVFRTSDVCESWRRIAASPVIGAVTVACTSLRRRVKCERSKNCVESRPPVYLGGPGWAPTVAGVPHCVRAWAGRQSIQSPYSEALWAEHAGATSPRTSLCRGRRSGCRKARGPCADTGSLQLNMLPQKAGNIRAACLL